MSVYTTVPDVVVGGATKASDYNSMADEVNGLMPMVVTGGTMTLTDSARPTTVVASGASVITLPTLADNLDRLITVVNGGLSSLTVTAETGETINGVTTYTVTSSYDVVGVIGHASEWLIVEERT